MIISFVNRYRVQIKVYFLLFLANWVLHPSNTEGILDRYQHVPVHTHHDYSAGPREDTVSPTAWPPYPAQSHYPDIEPTNPCPVLAILSTRQVSNYKNIAKFSI